MKDKSEVSNKIGAEVLLHQVQGIIDKIASNGGKHSLKSFQEIGFLDSDFKISKNFTRENFYKGLPLLEPCPSKAKEDDAGV